MMHEGNPGRWMLMEDACCNLIQNSTAGAMEQTQVRSEDCRRDYCTRIPDLVNSFAGIWTCPSTTGVLEKMMHANVVQDPPYGYCIDTSGPWAKGQ